VQDPNNNRTSTVYDATGRAIAKIDALTQRTTTVFDAAGRQIALIDARSNRNTFSYDAASQQVRRQNPLSQLTTLAYDAAGRQTLRIDARGNPTNYAYDPVGRVTNRRYPDGSRVTFAYDSVGNRITMQDSTGQYTNTFDPLSRKTVVALPSTQRLTYSHDAVSQRRSLVAPTGGRFSYTFDGAGRITLVKNPESDRTSYAYDVADRRIAKSLANGVQTSMTYDAADRLTKLADVKPTGAVISSFRYGYDNASNRTSVVEADGDEVAWKYDPTYQLINEQRDCPSYNVTHVYDPVGNRLLKIDSGARTTSTYDAANRQIYAQDSTGRTTFTYDATGNQTKQVSPTGTITTSVWDFENMNTSTELSPTNRVTLTYNGDQMRMEKNSTAGDHKFVYDEQNVLLQTDGSNLAQSVYTLEPMEYGNLVSQRQSQSGIWVPIYYHFDGLGSTASLTDNMRVITDTYTYFAFGKLMASTGTTTNPFTWVGQLQYVTDPETGEYQLHLRQYQPDRARFKSQDPLGQWPDPAEYRYVKNNPLGSVDPAGLWGPPWALPPNSPGMAHGRDFVRSRSQSCQIRDTHLIWPWSEFPGYGENWTSPLGKGHNITSILWLHEWSQYRLNKFINEFVSEWDAVVTAAAKEHCIPKCLLWAVILAELLSFSRTDYLEHVPGSGLFGYGSRSIGPAQLSPEIAKYYNLGEVSNNAETSIKQAADKIDKQLIELCIASSKRGGMSVPQRDVRACQALDPKNLKAMEPDFLRAFAGLTQGKYPGMGLSNDPTKLLSQCDLAKWPDCSRSKRCKDPMAVFKLVNCPGLSPKFSQGILVGILGTMNDIIPSTSAPEGSPTCKALYARKPGEWDVSDQATAMRTSFFLGRIQCAENGDLMLPPAVPDPVKDINRSD
jgi:RHS repeat-associated protein